MKKIMLAVMALCLFTACQFEIRTESHSWSDESDESEMTEEPKEDWEDEWESGLEAPAAPKPPSQTSRPSSSSTYESTSDNMRGFDPASEDDADDNGMSRYMENDDDEGWD